MLTHVGHPFSDESKRMMASFNLPLSSFETKAITFLGHHINHPPHHRREEGNDHTTRMKRQPKTAKSSNPEGEEGNDHTTRRTGDPKQQSPSTPPGGEDTTTQPEEKATQNSNTPPHHGGRKGTTTKPIHTRGGGKGNLEQQSPPHHRAQIGNDHRARRTGNP